MKQRVHIFITVVLEEMMMISSGNIVRLFFIIPKNPFVKSCAFRRKEVEIDVGKNLDY